MTRKNEMMAFVTIEDLYGSLEMLVFPKILREYSPVLNEESIVAAKGRVSFGDEDEPKFLCESIVPINTAASKEKTLYICIPERNGENLAVLSGFLMKYHGNSPVIIKFADSGKVMKAPEHLRCSLSSPLFSELSEFFGAENVIIK
ncbi:MAG: hypothetical protein J1F64_01210 [Oscillospiraceae bacterium]|nr:hypothetical protein [Oscillospiraceae bacterium]